MLSVCDELSCPYNAPMHNCRCSERFQSHFPTAQWALLQWKVTDDRWLLQKKQVFDFIRDKRDRKGEKLDEQIIQRKKFFFKNQLFLSTNLILPIKTTTKVVCWLLLFRVWFGANFVMKQNASNYHHHHNLSSSDL